MGLRSGDGTGMGKLPSYMGGGGMGNLASPHFAISTMGAYDVSVVFKTLFHDKAIH